MITLLMLSGGVDSTYLLAKLLKETDDRLVVHHIHLLTNSKRHLPEAASCKNIVKYCQKNYRSFSYTESGIDHRRFLSHGYDLIAAGFEAGVVASSFHSVTRENIDRWAVGLSLSDGRLKNRLRAADAVCAANCQQGTAPKFFEFPRVSQQEMTDYLPYELYKMTWSCRVPQWREAKYHACGKCPACERLAGAHHKDEALVVS
jgi:hypothetical protein